MKRISFLAMSVAALGFVACGPGEAPAGAQQAASASALSQSGGGGGGGGGTTEVITVSKCFTNATATVAGVMLIKAASSNINARLFEYLPNGTLLGEVQNGGGGQYGGTVFAYVPSNPLKCIIKSSTGGSATVPTTPFQI